MDVIIIILCLAGMSILLTVIFKIIDGEFEKKSKPYKLGKKVKKFLYKQLLDEYSKEEAKGSVYHRNAIITLSIRYNNGVEDKFVLGSDDEFYFQDEESEDTKIK